MPSSKVLKPSLSSPKYECTHCLKTYKTEKPFLKHVCPEMEKTQILRSPLGYAAYNSYSEWMKQHNRSVPEIETFKHSKYFNSFVKFAKLVISANISIIAWIRLMKKNDISPMLWNQSECYTMYLDWVDKEQDPMDQVVSSIKLLIRLSKALDTQLENVFTTLTINDIIDMVKTRGVSPWFLLMSSKFKYWLKEQDVDDIQQLQKIINPHQWQYKIEKNQHLTNDIKFVVAGLGL